MPSLLSQEKISYQKITRWFFFGYVLSNIFTCVDEDLNDRRCPCARRTAPQSRRQTLTAMVPRATAAALQRQLAVASAMRTNRQQAAQQSASLIFTQIIINNHYYASNRFTVSFFVTKELEYRSTIQCRANFIWKFFLGNFYYFSKKQMQTR